MHAAHQYGRVQRYTPREYEPTVADVQRSREFLEGAGLPAVLLPKALGVGMASYSGARRRSHSEGDRNIVENDPELLTRDVLVEFLFLRRTRESATRALVAHFGHAAFAGAHESVNVVLPFINHLVGGTVLTFSNLRAGTSIASVFGGVLMGAIADRTGPKTVLLLSHASAAASFCLVGAASSVRALYVSAVPMLFVHIFQVTTHVVTLSSDEPERARALGRVAALHALGAFTGGLLLLGALPLVTPSAVALMAACAEAGVVALIAMLYPADELAETVTIGDGGDLSSDAERARRLCMWRMLSRPGVLPVMTFEVVVSAAAGSVLFMVQQFAMHPFGFTASQAALVMVYLGGMQLVTPVLVSDGCSPRGVYLKSAISVGGSLLGMAVTPVSRVAFLLWLAPLSLCFAASKTTLGSMLTLYVPREEMGTVLGFSAAASSISHAVAVTASARVFEAYSFAAVPLAAGGFLLVATGAIFATGCVPPSVRDPDGCAGDPSACQVS